MLLYNYSRSDFMKTQKAIIDGIETDVIINLDDDYKDDRIIFNNDLENTRELPIEKIKEKIIINEKDENNG